LFVQVGFKSILAKMQVVDNQQCCFTKEKQVFTLLKIEHL